MKLTILGSCSGTEPMPERHHTSLTVTSNDRVYFFDAGENCSYTAHLLGIDLLKTRAVFISHCHYDHTGGLGGLLWNIRKLTLMRKENTADGEIKLYIPEMESWEGLYTFLKHTEGDFKCPFDITARLPSLGSFYEDENIKVTAFETHHMSRVNDLCRSFAYRIEEGDRSIVFSGDIKDHSEVREAVGRGCDILLMETGHHKVKDVCALAESLNVGRLIFVHHGREILNDLPTSSAIASQCRVKAEIAKDGMTVEL